MAEGSSPQATASGAPTVREVDARPVEDGVLHLIVMGANLFAMHPLPESGSVSIGRDENDDVRIDEPNASRHHARLHVGAVLEIEDTGSTNGTRLRGNLLPPGQRAQVLAGEAISIGWATLMIQRRRPTVRVRRLPTHAYFEGRLEEECDKASTTGRVFAVMRLHVAPGTSAETVGEHGHAVGSARRRARLVRARRVRADPVRARRQARRRLRCPRRRGCSAAAASPRAPASPSFPPTRARPTG